MSKFKVGDRVVKVTKSHYLGSWNPDSLGEVAKSWNGGESEAAQFTSGEVVRVSASRGYSVRWDTEVYNSTIHHYNLMAEDEYNALDERATKYLTNKYRTNSRKLEPETAKGLKVGDRVYHPTDVPDDIGTIFEIEEYGIGKVDWDGYGVLPHAKPYMDALLPIYEPEPEPEPEPEASLVLTLTLEEAKIIQKVLTSLTGHINE